LLKIVNCSLVTNDVLHLVMKSKNKVNCFPGQYLWLIMKDFDWEFTRSFSIVSNNNNLIELFIKLKENWRAWKLLRNVNIWDYFKITWVYWEFILQKTQNPKVFIWTWTWLAPLINMLVNNKYSTNNMLFFWVRKYEDLFWLEYLNKIQNLEKFIYLSKEIKKWYEYWRINLSNKNFDKNTEFYICWNPDMVINIELLLKGKGYSKIFSEKFN